MEEQYTPTIIDKIDSRSITYMYKTMHIGLLIEPSQEVLGFTLILAGNYKPKKQ